MKIKLSFLNMIMKKKVPKRKFNIQYTKSNQLFSTNNNKFYCEIGLIYDDNYYQYKSHYITDVLLGLKYIESLKENP